MKMQARLVPHECVGRTSSNGGTSSGEDCFFVLGEGRRQDEGGGLRAGERGRQTRLKCQQGRFIEAHGRGGQP